MKKPSVKVPPPPTHIILAHVGSFLSSLAYNDTFNGCVTCFAERALIFDQRLNGGFNLMVGSSLWQFTVASVLLALSPGPDIVMVITRSVAQGMRAGIIASLGFASGLTVHTTLAALGVAAMLKAHPDALMVVRCAGAAYLLYLAVRNVLSKS
ncbi:MAG: LysE family translocator, partial [Phycisphaerales bacterium]|nr:LysE family translocator [Phycisphaerales bacterium]